jgi:6-phosphogluconolactonase
LSGLPNLHVEEDAEALAHTAAARLCESAAASDGRLAICVSGGRTPKRLYELLASPPFVARFPWARAHWFWADERFVPPKHPDNNARMVYEAMLAPAQVPAAQIHVIATDGITPAQSAAQYERTLQAFYGADRLDPGRPLFDITLLGLGEDGHTASLFPRTAALDERDAWATAVIGARDEPRVTLTFPTLESSRETIFLVSGAGKRDVLNALAEGADLPANRLRSRGRVSWFLDRAAAPTA